MSAHGFDAAVVGGGPAGCAAAVVLARAGLRVALFEARAYPHDKLCGEFLSPECAVLLERLGAAQRLQALGPVPIRAARLTAPGGACWDTHFSAPAWGLSRSALDAALAEHARSAGVAVFEATPVDNITGDLRAGFELSLRGRTGGVRVRAAIAAHGKRAALDRALARPFLERRQPFMALKAHFHGPPLGTRIELHAFPGGYCGLSDVEGGLVDVCLLVREDVFRARGARPQDFVEWMQRANPRLGEWWQRAERADPRWISIAQVPFTAKGPLAGDVLLAGDAAGLIVPLAGDGISMALRSGEMAAGLAAAFLRAELPGDALPARYAAAWRREFAGRFRLARVLHEVMLRPGLLAPGLRLLQAVPALGRYLVAHTRDSTLLGAPPVVEEKA